MKKFIFNFIISLTLLVSSANLAAIMADPLPEKFNVTERWLSWSITFDISVNDQSIGLVHRKVFSLMPEYHLYDAEHNLVSKARMRFLSFMPTFDVTDAQNQTLGKVKEKFAFFFPTFSIFSAQNHRLAEAKLNLWGTKYTLCDSHDGHIIASMQRPLFRFKNNWKIEILDTNAFNHETIHPHMLLTIAAFQADREYWEAQARSIKNLTKSKQQATLQAVSSKEILENKLLAFRHQINQYGLAFENVEPAEEHFKTIESMEEFSSFLEMDETLMAYITALFQSSELAVEEKAALLIMLKQIL